MGKGQVCLFDLSQRICCLPGHKASHTGLLQGTTSPQSGHRAAYEELQEQDTVKEKEEGHISQGDLYN